MHKLSVFFLGCDLSVRFCLSVHKNTVIIFFTLGVGQTVSGSGVSNHMQWPLDDLSAGLKKQ